jgi:hypothetical protein
VYRRLFLPAYLEAVRALAGPFRHMLSRGQSLDAAGRSRPDVPSSLHGLDDCFPFQVLRLEVAAREFHDFYGR